MGLFSGGKKTENKTAITETNQIESDNRIYEGDVNGYADLSGSHGARFVQTDHGAIGAGLGVAQSGVNASIASSEHIADVATESLYFANDSVENLLSASTDQFTSALDFSHDIVDATRASQENQLSEILNFGESALDLNFAAQQSVTEFGQSAVNEIAGLSENFAGETSDNFQFALETVAEKLSEGTNNAIETVKSGQREALAFANNANRSEGAELATQSQNAIKTMGLISVGMVGLVMVMNGLKK